MTIDYKKLLPSSMRTTRWGQFMEAIQSVLADIKTDKIEVIENQWNINEVTATQIKIIRDILGYDFLDYDSGWSSNLEYLKRQILTVVPRIENRTTKKAYDYDFYIYNLIGNAYPMYYDEAYNYLHPKTTWWTYNEESEDSAYATLDMGFTLDEDSPYVFPHLDSLNEIDRHTRHILIPYEFRNIDKAGYFQTEDTLTCLYEDVLYAKKTTEIPHFEPICKANIISGVASTKEYYFDYDVSVSGIVESYYYDSVYTDRLSGIAGIQFGTGSHSAVVVSGVTGVKTPLVYSGLVNGILWESDLDTITETATRYNARRNIKQNESFASYTEVALLDINSGVVAYATFPQITYLPNKSKFYGNPQIDFTLV